MVAVRVEAAAEDVEMAKLNERYYNGKHRTIRMHDNTYYQKIYSSIDDDGITFPEYFRQLYEPYVKAKAENYYKYQYICCYFVYNEQIYFGKIKTTPYETTEQMLSPVMDTVAINDIQKAEAFFNKDYYKKEKIRNILMNISSDTFNVSNTVSCLKGVSADCARRIFSFIVQNNASFLLTAMPLVCKEWNVFWHTNEIQAMVHDVLTFNRVFVSSFLTGYSMPFHFFTDNRFCKNFKIKDGKDWHQFFLRSEILYYGSAKNMTLQYIKPEERDWCPPYKNTLQSNELLKICLNYDDNSLNYYYPALSFSRASINVINQLNIANTLKKKYTEGCIALEHTIIVQILKKSHPNFFATKYTLSLVCKDWYRYLKESSTICNLKNSILHCTCEFARYIRQTFFIHQDITSYLQLRKNLLFDMENNTTYDKNELWKKINYQKIKKELFQEDTRSSSYMKLVFGYVYFIETVEQLQSLFAEKNFMHDITETKVQLKLLLNEAVTNNSYLKKLKEEFEFISRKKHTSAALLYSFIEKNKQLCDLLQSTSINTDKEIMNDKKDLLLNNPKNCDKEDVILNENGKIFDFSGLIQENNSKSVIKSGRENSSIRENISTEDSKSISTIVMTNTRILIKDSIYSLLLYLCIHMSKKYIQKLWHIHDYIL
ncbi:MAG TPA: hypothetical protein VL201_01550 [Patescibacteria group bacterium]|nr:hypothetical protein [Patescibacteria group bacterium]